MILIEIKGDPPNKQLAAHKRNVSILRQELSKIQINELKSKTIRSPVSIEVNLYTSLLRYVREGRDNTYIGDLDNLLSGIFDELKGTIIDDDSRVMEIIAKKNVIEDEENTRYTVLIQRQI